MQKQQEIERKMKIIQDQIAGQGQQKQGEVNQGKPASSEAIPKQVATSSRI